MESEFEEYDSLPNGWVYLFQQLRVKARNDVGPMTVARLPINQGRNRYRDVLPVDETRVQLEDNENDYINANHVTVTDVNKRYILTQGPLRQTSAHFWQMVWEQKTVGIVMLNKIIEKGMLKCEPYWPATESRSPMDHDQFKVTLKAVDKKFAYTTCKLELTNLELDETREVIHFQYTDWPDFGVPETADLFLTFLQEVRESGALGNDVGPCIVHCSAGIGRSGTLCLVDVILARIQKTGDADSVDIQGTLLEMRRQRYGLIQTPEQLRFSYIAILEGAAAIVGNGVVVQKDLEEEEEDEDEDEEEEEEEEEKEEQQVSNQQDWRVRKQPSEESPSKKVRFNNDESNSDDNSPSEDEVILEEEEEEEEVEDDAPPPLPPRPPSLEKEMDQLSEGLSSGNRDIYSDKFLDEQPPPPPAHRSVPPSIPPRKVSVDEESFLEEAPTQQTGRENGTSDVAGVRRRERQAHLAAKVQDMRHRLQESEGTQPVGWSPYLIVAAFASVLFFIGLKWLFF